jgi:hypothetical protein
MSHQLRKSLAILLTVMFAWLAAPAQSLFAEEHAVSA